MDRRTFVKSLAALGVISIAPAAVSGCAPHQAGDAQPSATQYDIVIIGSGGAGMAAALSAHESGVESIVVLEKLTMVGGNTNFSSSGMNASETVFQKDLGIDDSNELFIQDTFEGGREVGRRDLIEHMCDGSAEAIAWLDSIGITLDNITLTGGSSVKRCHRPTDGSAVGKTLVPHLQTTMEDQGLPLLQKEDVVEIIMTGGKATGVKTEGGTIYEAKAVIIATGGFGANFDMIAEYRPDLKDYVTTNSQGTQGDGMRMAAAVGADLVDMEQIQIHPTVDQATGSLIAEGMRGGGAILVNSQGMRFVDEMETRDVVSAAELEQPGKFAYVVYDQKIYDANKDAANYEKLGLTIKADSLEGLAEALNIDPVTLTSTVEVYNALSKEGTTDEFGRAQGLAVIDTPAFYAHKVAPGIHHCMGGILTDTQCRVLDASETPLEGLYAAGETTGGIHGANRLGGNAVCDIMVNGRQAGHSAADYVKG